MVWGYGNEKVSFKDKDSNSYLYSTYALILVAYFSKTLP